MPSSLQFDGDNDFVELGSIEAGNPLRLNGSNGSLLAWVKPTAAGTDAAMRVIDKSDGGNGQNGYCIFVDGPTRSLAAAINSTVIVGRVTPFPDPEDGNVLHAAWTPIAWTWDGTTHKLYAWGELVDSASSSARPPDATTNMRIGTWNHSTAREFGGNLRDISLHNAALTQEQIRAWITSGVAPTGNLAGHWLLEDGSGTTATDETGNNHGTLTNGPTWSADYPWMLDEFGSGGGSGPRIGSGRIIGI